LKKTIDFLAVCLLPTVIIIAYSYCYLLIEAYRKRTFDFFAVLPISILVNIIVGICLFFICKHAIKRQDTKRMPFEYLIGLLLVIIVNLGYFLPLPVIVTVVFGFGLRLSGVFVGVYICLFIYLMSHRKKSIQMQDKVQSD
jgi:integral membrane sensor domain MASE1